MSGGTSSARGPIQRVGLIGHPVAHSLSPRMQQAAFDALGIPARYELWDTPPQQLADRIATLREPGMLGANLTIPHKAAVVPLLDEIDPQARRVAGVVNTIVRVPSPTGVRLVGHNTDALALARILDEQAQWRTRHVVVLGAGGAARAALGAARAHGTDVWVAARRSEAALSALESLWEREHTQGAGRPSTPLPSVWHERALALDDTARLAKVLGVADVLVQATSVGMERHGDAAAALQSPLSLELLDQLPAHALVFDAIYAPRETVLIRSARDRGLRASGGLLMLLYQGAAAFTLWTGKPAPLAVMQAALGL